MKKRNSVFLAAILVADAHASSPQCSPLQSQSTAVVATSEKAVAAALPALQKEFGATEISQFMPFQASLQNNIWYVRGTLPKEAIGGTPEAEVCKTNGEVIHVYHTQ